MSFNKGPEYDKRPEIKNYTRESTFKVPRKIIIIGFFGVVIIAFFLIFNPFSSIEKDLVDTKWEFSDSDDVYDVYDIYDIYTTASKNFYFIQLLDENTFTYSKYVIPDNYSHYKEVEEELIVYSQIYNGAVYEKLPENIRYNLQACNSCRWEVKKDSIYLYKSKTNSRILFSGKLNSRKNLISGNIIGKKIED